MEFDEKSITLNAEEIKIIRNWHTEEYNSEGYDFILKRKIDSWIILYGGIENGNK